MKKAREAVESVHTARHPALPRRRIRNVGTPTGCADNAEGAFVTSASAASHPGPDGLVNTGDDGEMEMSLRPGPDGILGTADDIETPMTNYTRQIEIANILLPNGTPNPNLRRMTVTIVLHRRRVAADLFADDLHLGDFLRPGSCDISGIVKPFAAADVGEQGFTLVELLVTMAITTVILGATMAAMTDAIKATESATQITDMNNGLRTAMDLMVRDMLQVGQGLPGGRAILVPERRRRGGDPAPWTRRFELSV